MDSYLEKLIGEKIYTIASDGASNHWMTKILDYIIPFKPKSIFVMFGFNHYYSHIYNNTFFYNWQRENIKVLEYKERRFLKDRFDYVLTKFKQQDCKEIPVLCSANPNFDDLYDCSEYYKELVTYDRFFNNDFEKLKNIGDLARDGVHFGTQTSQDIAENFYKKFKLRE